MGTPSTTISGRLPPDKDATPRNTTLVDPSTPEGLFEICSPATLPAREFITLFSLAWETSEASTMEMEYPSEALFF